MDELISHAYHTGQKDLCKTLCLHWVPFLTYNCLTIIFSQYCRYDLIVDLQIKLQNSAWSPVRLWSWERNVIIPGGSAIFLAVWFHLTWCALKRKGARWLWKSCSPASLKSPVTEIHLAYAKSRSWPASCPVISSSLKRHSWGLEWICDAVPNQELEHFKTSEIFSWVFHSPQKLYLLITWFQKKIRKNINTCNTYLSSLGKFTFHRGNHQRRV